MKTFALMLLVATLAISPAEAGDTLTVEQAINATTGLQQLAAHETVDKDGKPTKTYYKFSGETRIAIAVDIDRGVRVRTQFQNAVNDLVMQMSNGSGIVPPEKKGAFDVETSKMIALPARADFVRLKWKDLNLDENPIPAPILALLVPIVDP